jgi:hypothetical protein
VQEELIHSRHVLLWFFAAALARSSDRILIALLQLE